MRQPFDVVVLITAATRGRDREETLFPTDTFLRAFTQMAYNADQTLRDLLGEMEHLGRKRRSAGQRAANRRMKKARGALSPPCLASQTYPWVQCAGGAPGG